MKLLVTTREGVVVEAEAQLGRSVMEGIRDAGISEVLAICGGCCSCATCHVHVDEDWLERLPRMSPEENDLLDASSDRDERSRLSCQIKVTEALNGLSVTIAAED